MDPTGMAGEQATVTWLDARGHRRNFVHDHAGSSGSSGPCGSAICVTAAGYAIKTAEGYTIATSDKVQMTATSYWVITQALM
jgi:hypothetical protein